eukprot:TRINITY_DN16931_c0_g1_i1.p1 TRINITY_DN16931_c0_g1~~TRINITY_DN16931_c0_g1_i1.p1  ORF type:complete len:181 (+),score=41.76 TRINITY_DN16931_c0_g1_i1:54-596(+)
MSQVSAGGSSYSETSARIRLQERELERELLHQAVQLKRSEEALGDAMRGSGFEDNHNSSDCNVESELLELEASLVKERQRRGSIRDSHRKAHHQKLKNLEAMVRNSVASPASNAYSEPTATTMESCEESSRKPSFTSRRPVVRKTRGVPEATGSSLEGRVEKLEEENQKHRDRQCTCCVL